MGKLKLDDILKATRGSVLEGDQTEFAGLSTDSRTIGEGELFLALKGPNFDGHAFLKDALSMGGGALVQQRPAGTFGGKTLVLVEDTLKGLHDIARFLRSRRAVPAIGVTGTNGKTTTKELIASIFGKQKKVLKTVGNLNNHIGLPLCISRMDGDEDVMVLEMGSNAEGDIRLLCDIARPDFAVVTNVGPAHLEGFGNVETVRKTDLEILAYAKTACINAEDLFLLEGTRGFDGRLITYGFGDSADVRASDIMASPGGSRFMLHLPGSRQIGVALRLCGRFNVLNALAAASVADECGIEPGVIKSGLESFMGVPMRLEIRELDGLRVISDVYNANPASMEEALKELARQKKSRTIAVLGDMLELGAYSAEAHAGIVRLMSDMGVDIFIAVGPEMRRAAAHFHGACYTAEDSFIAGSILSGICGEGDTILLKGSRGMKMEKVLDFVLATREGRNAL